MLTVKIQRTVDNTQFFICPNCGKFNAYATDRIATDKELLNCVKCKIEIQTIYSRYQELAFTSWQALCEIGQLDIGYDKIPCTNTRIKLDNQLVELEKLIIDIHKNMKILELEEYSITNK